MPVVQIHVDLESNGVVNDFQLSLEGQEPFELFSPEISELEDKLGISINEIEGYHLISDKELEWTVETADQACDGLMEVIADDPDFEDADNTDDHCLELMRTLLTDIMDRKASMSSAPR